MQKIKTFLNLAGSYLKNLFTDRKFLICLAILFTPVFLGIIGVIITYNHYSSELPSLAQLEQINPKLVTNIYDMNGKIAHEYFVERREWTPFDSIPENAIHAVMATEDRAFYKHWGMNVWAIPSAIIESALSGKQLRGASTLTQQLTKLLFLTPERSIARKIKEAMTAIRIEQTYTKQEILEFYMNEVYLGGGNYGFQAAGKYYFGRPLDSLTIPEYAVLAGMLKAPESYRPDRHPKASLERRNTVLYAMYDAGYISKEDYRKYIATPMEKKYGQNSLYADGVSIFSTIDPDIQSVADSVAKVTVAKYRTEFKKKAIKNLKLAEKYEMDKDSVYAHFDSVYALFKKDYLEKDNGPNPKKWRYPPEVRYHEAQIAMVVIENETGAIRAMVGGNDFNESRYNRAVQSLRQPGSSFKPIVYSVAMDNGASPCDSVNDAPITMTDETAANGMWRPHNSEKNFEGMMTLRKALYRSKNIPAVLTASKYGLSAVVNYARAFGIRKAPLVAVPSLALGSVGATLLEMTSAYTVFPNLGTRIEPYMIESIEDKNGEVIEKNSKIESVVMKQPSAYLMVDILKDVNLRGTGYKVTASGFNHPSGGKTGTTNDYTDAWYIGFTKHYTMGVWVGFDQAVSMGVGHTGGNYALPPWIAVMTKIHKGLRQKSFPVPAGVIGKGVCNITGKLAGEFCTEKTYCLYTTNNYPDEVCDGDHYKVRTKSADDATLFSNKGSIEHSEGAKKTRKMF